MNVTSKISVDLIRANFGGRVNAMQCDGNTRLVEITLLAGGAPWTPPADAEAAIAYRQPGGTKGLYNKLADGTPAISINGNVATIILAPQMLTAPGTVQVSIVFNDAQLNQLTAFPFYVSVEKNPYAGAQKTEDYIRLQWLEDKLDEYIAKVGGGGTVDPEAVRQIVINYLTANPPTVEETDPTVPAWAKQPTKPTYTAAEVGALPDTYTPPSQTAQQVGADPSGTAATAVSQHNTDTAAHNDLRIALQGLSDRINAALDSDDTTLDQMSEVVAYIKSNKSLIDAITTSKVSVADIVNDLATNVTDKPLSAAQGVVLKGLIDDLQGGGSGKSGGHWETIYEYVSDNIVVTDFSVTYNEENKYSILTVPNGVLSEFNVGDYVILAIFPLDGTSAWSTNYITGSQYDIQKNKAVILSEVEIRIQFGNDRSDITPSNAVIEIMHGDIPKIFEDTIAFNPTSKLRYTGVNTGGDISGYTFPLFYGLRYMGNRSEGYLAMKTKHMNLIANLEVANGLLLFHHTLSANMLSSTSAYNNKWTDREVVGYIDAPTSYMTDGKLTSMILGSSSGTPIFPRKGGFIRIEGWYE